MSIPLITVAVPAYNRSTMMVQLIRSFQLQDYANAELLIVDDCMEDDLVRQVVAEFQSVDTRIRYHKNSHNLGYAQNFLEVLLRASGDYIVVLGDDDLLYDKSALSRYNEIFSSYPDVGYIYSNQIQFNTKHELDYVFRHFDKSSYFASGYESLQSTWLRSCYIPGIALRNDVNFADIFPEATPMLFPQVEMIGRLVLTRASFGCDEFLVAGRAHDAQLGFAATKDVAELSGRHSVEELDEIAERIARLGVNEHDELHSESLHRIVSSFFRNAHATIFPTEKIHGGNRRIIVTMRQALQNDRKSILDLRFISYFVVSLLLPKFVLRVLKERVKVVKVRRQFTGKESEFSGFMEEIRLS